MQKVNLNLWDGFHDTLIDLVMKGEEEMGELVKPVFAALPMYLLTLAGKVDLTLDSDGIAELLKVPEAALAGQNAHSFLSSYTVLGTIDDLDLVNNADLLFPIVWGNHERNWESLD